MANRVAASVRVFAIVFTAVVVASCASMSATSQRDARAAPVELGHYMASEALRIPIDAVGAAPAVDLTSSATFDIRVVLGWNFVSMPLMQGSVGPANFTLPGILDYNGANSAMWDRAMYYSPLDPADPWKQYNKNWGSGLNDFTQISNGIGFLVHVVSLGDGIMTVGGLEFAYPSGSTLVPLFTGWNMMGFPSNQAITVGTFKAAVGAPT